MAENKTKPTKESVKDFLNSITDEQKRKDCIAISKMMQEVSGEKPVLWGPSIVGFGTCHYKYASGREGDTMLIGFSPRKQNITLYIWISYCKANQPLLKKLGKHKTAKSCLYINKLAEVDTSVLKEIMVNSYEATKEMKWDRY